MKVSNFYKFKLFCGTKNQLIAELETALEDQFSKQCKFVSCLNPHSLAVSKSRIDFRLALQNARWLIPDGIGVVLGARMLGLFCAERIPGFDVFKDFSERLDSKSSCKVFFLGSTVATLKKLVELYSSDFKNIEVVGYYSPPFKENFVNEDKEIILQKINNSGADIVWVGLSSPKQDIWMFENVKQLDAKLAFGIGAVFDFYIGNVKRSPVVIQKLGLEWLHRLLQEPRRLWRRTIISGPIFVLAILLEYLRDKIKIVERFRK